jgi:uncharacterized surface protein with fasciclin (FAS1) repeats
MKKLLKLLPFLTIILLLSSCSDDDDDTIIPVSNTIVDVAINNDLTSLVAAVVRADLAETLSGDGPFTVFAPTNAAFQELLDSNPEWNSVDDIPVETLQTVLLFHVLSGEVTSSDLSDTFVNTLATGLDGNPLQLQIEVTGGVKFNGDATPVAVDVDASNGVVHVIDKVMIPSMEESNTIVDVAINNNLTSLVAAVVRADLAETLSGDGPFTVFAPTNAAFQDLLDSNTDWNSVDDIPVETLQAVLLFHVLSGEVRSTDLSDTYVNTLSTGPNDEALSLQVELTGAIEFNGDAKPVTVDVEASNGVVHVIDKVMLPPTIVELALNNAGFTSLVAALTDSRHTTNFVDVLNGDGPFTVFAPTNDAFQALLDSNTDWNSLGDIPIATLEAVLLYHVVGANVQSDELSNGDVTTLGGTITIDLTDGAQIKTSTQTVNIILTDVQGWNGVVHAIDAVLLPM